MEFETQSSVISLEQATFSIATPDGLKPIIKDIDLSIKSGEWLAIVGTNGSGKSTLAKIITKLYPVSSGEVKHHDPISKDKDSVKDGLPFIQMIFQNPETQMIGETVFEDVCFGLDNYGVHPRERDTLAMNALNKVGLGALKDRPTLALSGGQKQLLHVAGCLAVKPAVLLFDEATSMLDPMSRKALIRTTRQLNSEGTTIIWITQLLDELAECDRILALESGRVVFSGSKETFFYGETKETLTPTICEQLGFTLPYTVQVTQELIKRGVSFPCALPFTAKQLGRAIIL